jgi:hypothetical protein
MGKRPLHENLSNILSMIMALVYTGGGVFLISSSSSFNLLPDTGAWRIALAVVLIAYGCMRGYRAWKGLKEFKEQ